MGGRLRGHDEAKRWGQPVIPAKAGTHAPRPIPSSPRRRGPTPAQTYTCPP
ncbi:hypothetical protein X805_08010 [Sphaerotilus natans subsp. natans DSM 6575]|uniref:Uncharacterized protein n=1 Tax=Sphaerotilus natans subsp. natans DSM 6575 TaxID=1286631 RepID=A0A059KQI3_9BURK|nr:hypothetical protein X805_08010 [Sphaerotilus natans subsp. natans DSM 6575]